MVSGITLGGYQPSSIGSLNLSFSEAAELDGCEETLQAEAFNLDCERVGGVPLNYRE